MSDGNQENPGKVWLVGAGPSDPGLFTLKGKEILETAQVVAYDALVGASVLSMIPDTAETVYVGKRAGKHTVLQEQISELLAEKAREGKRVVRLKGGDPFVFGRGGEELELLAREGIPFEVVPGVTSAFAVPAYQGIPVTHRDYCSSVHLITGHKRAGMESDIDFEALARTKGTLLFLMGVGALGDICRGLLGAGMNPGTPAALLMQGTTAAQDMIPATLATLEAEVEARGAKTPAIIVVGNVCGLAGQFSWYGKQPLGGARVLLVRPRERMSETAKKLRALGADVLEMPTIRIQKIARNKRLQEALDEVDAYRWLVFTSPAGVRIFFEELAERRKDVRCLYGRKIAVIGSGTERELESHGLFADLMPEQYDGEHLAHALAGVCEADERILIARSSIGNPELTNILRAAGVRQVDDVPVYDTVYEKSPVIDIGAEIGEKRIDYAVFTSASTVRGLAAAAGDAALAGLKAVCIGRQTAVAAKALGMDVEISEKATIDSVIGKVLELHGRNRKE